MLGLVALTLSCAATVAPTTMAAIVEVESSGNPYAIGVVGGRLDRQPESLAEALSVVQRLDAGGWNYSVGLAQINRDNLPRYGVTAEQAFDPCTNLEIGAAILSECYTRASLEITDPQRSLRMALSCYYSGNFTRGFRPDTSAGMSYVQRVLSAATK